MYRERTPFQPVGLGIIGTGTIFEQHAHACTNLAERVRLLAVADTDEIKLRKATSRHFIPFAYQDYGQLIERTGIDVVSVCTPPSSHEKIVIDALEAGKFVICEKPLGHTLQAVDRIVDAARRFPGKLSTVYQLRYLPEVQRTVWLRQNGRLGRLLFGRFSRYARFEKPGKIPKPGKIRKPRKTRASWWGRWDVAGGGVVMTQLIHELDLMYHIFGRPVEVSAAIDTLKQEVESEDTCAATIRFESGAIGCCYGTLAASRTHHAFDVLGEEGSVHYPWSLEGLSGKWRKKARRDVLSKYPSTLDPPTKLGRLQNTLPAGVTKLWRRVKPGAKSSTHTRYYSAVLDAIENGEPLPIGPEEARVSLELCTGIYMSALSGEPSPLPIDGTNRYYAGFTTKDYDGRKRRDLRAIEGALPARHPVERERLREGPSA